MGVAGAGFLHLIIPHHFAFSAWQAVVFGRGLLLFWFLSFWFLSGFLSFLFNYLYGYRYPPTYLWVEVRKSAGTLAADGDRCP